MSRDFSHVKRVVIKVGTNLLTNSKGIDTNRIDQVVDSIVALREKIYRYVGHFGLSTRAKELGHANAVKQIALRQLVRR